MLTNHIDQQSASSLHKQTYMLASLKKCGGVKLAGEGKKLHSEHHVELPYLKKDGGVKLAGEGKKLQSEHHVELPYLKKDGQKIRL